MSHTATVGQYGSNMLYWPIGITVARHGKCLEVSRLWCVGVELYPITVVVYVSIDIDYRIICCSYCLINNRAFSATRNWGCDSKTASQWLLRIGKPGGKVLQLPYTRGANDAQIIDWLLIDTVDSCLPTNLTEFHHGFLYFIILLFFLLFSNIW